MQNNRNNGKSFNKGPKPVFVTLPFIISGKDFKGNDYDADSCAQIVMKLADNDVFSILNVSATMSKKICFNDDNAKGTISVARIQSFDVDDGMKLGFFGNNIKYAENLDGMVIVPRIRAEKGTGKVISINSFEIVPAMDA